jgi:hypothetical protein
MEMEKVAARRSRISPGTLAEIEGALRVYEEEVREAGRSRDGIKEATIKTYIQGPEKFVAWLRCDFAPGASPNQLMAPRPEFDALKVKRLAPKKARISLPALMEAEAALDEFVREVLQARLGERATNQLGDHAEYFTRWLKYEFAPGSRKGWR